MSDYLTNRLYDSLQESIDAGKASKDEARKHYRYYYGDQLPQDVLAVLQRRGQPIRWENEYRKIAAKIQGVKINSRQEIKVVGRQIDEDRDIGHILTDILRSLPDSTDFYDQKDAADLDLLLAGICVLAPEIETLARKDRFGKSEKALKVTHIPYEECYFDPSARRKDYLDARYFHRVCWIEKERLEEIVKDKSALEGVIYNSDPYFSRSPNIDTAYGRKRALIVYSWFREDGKIKYRLWDYSSKTALLEGDSPYRFNRFPIAARALYRDRNALGSTHGLFRDVMPIQDSINFKLLRVTNLLGSHKLLIETDAVADAREFLEDYSRDDGVAFVEHGAITGGKIKDITNHAAIDKLMQLIIDDRKQAEAVIGLNDEALGMAVNRLSAKAIERRQNAGMLGLRNYLEASDQLDRDLYGLCIEMIQQFFDAEQVFRIVDENKAIRYFAINEAAVGENGVEIESEVGAINGSARGDKPRPKLKNKLDVGRYDVVLQTVPQSLGSAADRYAHSKEIMQILAAVDPRLAAEFLPHLLREIDSPAADPLRDLLDKREQAQEQAAQSPEAQAQARIAQAQAQTDLALAAAKVKEAEGSALAKAATAKETLERAKYHGDYARAEAK
ncbi:MAG: hypothetical protein LBP89_06505 [Helicobacteraceae bacterium]|jgi:hypothetical protein|nr:hypothetical protein [Helicobacteraceae bacterium]